MLISRTAAETWVFRRFLDTQPKYRRSRWKRSGGGHEPPDFIISKEKIGVELGEWLHKQQTADAREIDRFERGINKRATAKRISAFAKSLTRSTEERYMTLADVKSLPRRREKDLAIDLLLDYLRTAKKPETARERKHGVIYAAELPQAVASFFRSVHLRRLRSGGLQPRDQSQSREFFRP